MLYNTNNLRRHERTLPETTAKEVLTRSTYGILSMQHYAGRGYGIPLHYVWDGADKIYFHVATTGEKLRHLTHSPDVSFCVVGEERVLPEHFSTAYRSIILQGSILQIKDKKEKIKALHMLLQKYTPQNMERGKHYTAHAVEKTLILQLSICSWCGKHGFEVP